MRGVGNFRLIPEANPFLLAKLLGGSVLRSKSEPNINSNNTKQKGITMTDDQKLKHYRKVLERIRDWARTSAGSCDILRGFARRALEEVDSVQDK